MTAGLVSFPSRCRVVTLVFSSAFFFFKLLCLFHQLGGRALRRILLVQGVFVYYYRKKVGNRGQMACFHEECNMLLGNWSRKVVDDCDLKESLASRISSD